MIQLARYILFDHFTLAVDAALLLAVGLFVSVPVVKYRIRFLHWLPVHIMEMVPRLMGKTPGLVRMALVIWLFNSTVMFVYMASGFHPVMPKLFGIWTGLNIGIVLARSRAEMQEGRSRFMPAPPQHAWRPPPPLAGACGLLVLALELPCFFYAIALGMRMGADTAWGGAPYLEALSVRAAAYGAVIMPVLLVSAVAEAVAIRGGSPESEGRQPG